MGLGLKEKFRWINTHIIYGLRRNITLDKTAIIEGSIEADRSGQISVGGGTRIRRWVCLKPYGGKISIGNNCTINSFVHISGNGNVEIGNNVLIATQCVIVSANHNFDDINNPINRQGETREKIIIEDNVWLGAGVKVLAGVTIHSGSVIGAGSVITKDVPMNSVVVGVPGQVIKKRC